MSRRKRDSADREPRERSRQDGARDGEATARPGAEPGDDEPTQLAGDRKAFVDAPTRIAPPSPEVLAALADPERAVGPGLAELAEPLAGDAYHDDLDDDPDDATEIAEASGPYHMHDMHDMHDAHGPAVASDGLDTLTTVKGARPSGPVPASASGAAAPASAPAPASTIDTTLRDLAADEPTELADAEASFVGRFLCGYKLLRTLGEGGMAVVYLGEHAQIGKLAALKVLRREFCKDERIVQRFIQEARTVNEIHHDNIVDVFDFGRGPDGRVCLAMELLEGETLEARLLRGPVPWPEARAILEQVLRGLGAAHERGVVHRDLKPDNIWLKRGADGQLTVKLLDFGIAKLVDASGEGKLTQTGAMVGTPHYMSPEQIDGADVDLRSDIYSLGVILYEMFAGQRPFAGKTLRAVISGHLLNPPPPIVRVPDGVPPGITAVIGRMLAKQPGDRQPDTRAVVGELQALSGGRPPAGPPGPPGSPGASPGASPGWGGGPMPGPMSGPPRRPMPGQIPGPPRGPNPGQIPGPPRGPLPGQFSGPGGAHLTDAARRRRLALWLGGAGIALIGLLVIALVAGGDDAPETPGPRLVDPTPSDLAALREQARGVIAAGLAHAEPRVRANAWWAVAEMHDAALAREHAGRLDDEPAAEVKAQIASALAEVGIDATEPLIALYRGAAGEHRAWYAEALARAGHDDARGWLAELSGDADVRTAYKAARALAELSPADDQAAVRALRQLAGREKALVAAVDPYVGVELLAYLARLRERDARSTLHELVANREGAMRLPAAVQLASVGDDTGAQVLREALADGSMPERVTAALALIDLGDYSGYAALTEGLAAAEADVRLLAVRGLGAIGERASLPALVALYDDPDPVLRINAAVAVFAIASLDPVFLAENAESWAQAELDSPDVGVRATTARMLGALSPDSAAPLLLEAIADPAPQVRLAAAESAAEVDDPAVAPAVAGALASAARGERDERVREKQVVALAGMAEASTRDVLDDIAKEPSRAGVLALGGLARLGEDTAVTRLGEAGASDKPALRKAAMEAAGLANNREVVPTLETGARDGDFGVRVEAAIALVKYQAGLDLARPVLEEAAAGEEPSVKGRANAAIARLGGKRDRDRAEKSARALLASLDPTVRGAALLIVAALPWADARPLLGRALADLDPAVRRRAAAVLGTFRDGHVSELVPIYKSLLRDDDAGVRAIAGTQLARVIAGVMSSGGDGAPAAPAPDAAPADAEPAPKDAAADVPDAVAPDAGRVADEPRKDRGERVRRERPASERKQIIAEIRRTSPFNEVVGLCRRWRDKHPGDQLVLAECVMRGCRLERKTDAIMTLYFSELTNPRLIQTVRERCQQSGVRFRQ